MDLQLCPVEQVVYCTKIMMMVVMVVVVMVKMLVVLMMIMVRIPLVARVAPSLCDQT